MASKKKSASKRSSRAVTVKRSTKSRPMTDTAVWVGGLAVVAAAAVGGIAYYEHKKANGSSSNSPIPPPGVNPAPGPVAPSGTLPTTGDVFSSLTSAQQQAVQNSLYAYITQTASPCLGVFSGPSAVTGAGINSASDLTAGQNLTLAVTCYQQGYNAANSGNLGAANGSGVLDIATYNALMNTDLT